MPAAVPVTFTDVTAAAGIAFTHETGAFGKKYLPETMGSGAAFLDYDGDGDQDLFLANGTTWPERTDRVPALQALYRNRGDGTFEDVSGAAGLKVEAYGMGVAAGDYDNDGHVDLFLNALGPDHLFRSRGDGTFEDVTGTAGVSDPAYGSCATFVDFDRDGWLDLFACNYVVWSPEGDLFCTLDGTAKSYCTPESYTGATNRLYRNKGDGAFEDVTERAGVLDPSGKTLGVVVFDHDGDSWPDLAVANDTQPNFLYRNKRDGTFEEIGREVGVAFGESGAARGAMGIDAADYDGSGRESLVIGNFANEMTSLYHNEGSGLYVDDAPMAGVGAPSLLALKFAALFFDHDLDGWLDILTSNGHVEPEVNAVQADVTYAQPPHLYRNLGDGRYAQVTTAGADFDRPIVGRGAAVADVDGDGDLDVLFTTSGGPARLLRNDGAERQASLRVTLVGSESNRDGLGAQVVATVGGRTLRRMLRGASSYLSQSENVATFGLGAGGTVDQLEVRWPSGKTQTVSDVPDGQAVRLTVREDGRVEAVGNVAP